jgi:alpha-galactosidase
MPIHTTAQAWVCQTDRTAYVLGLNAQGLLVTCYWGPRLPALGDYPAPPDPPGWSAFNGPAQLAPEEYPAYNALSYVEPCLKLSFADGTRDTRLRLHSSRVVDQSDDPAAEIPELRLTLCDEHYALSVTMTYRVHERYDLIERLVRLENNTGAALTIERGLTAQWHPPAGKRYRLSHLTGRWFEEGQLRRDWLPHATTLLESRRLTSSHHHSPFFMLDDGHASHDAGHVYAGGLEWSGNWKLLAETTDFGQTRLSMGLNDWDFAYRLEHEGLLELPPCVAVLSAAGFGGASRLLHAYARDTLMRTDRVPRQVVYNSWEATQFEIDIAQQSRLAEIAAQLGVEIFVVDDGWFHRRDDDRAALGDWWPDARKFPDGLTPLIAHVTRLGMQFGIWIEPEMVSPDSELYRAHPDWVVHFPTRPRTEARNQLILNMARPDVQDYLIGLFDHLLADHDIAYVKWDMNRNVSEPGWPGAPGDPRELWVRYVWGLYRVWKTLRERHPRVTWLSCSGGGGRADLGILRLADRVQISDNTDATAILRMQEGFAQFLPASSLESWVTDVAAERLPLAFRFHAAMTGALVLGSHLDRWDAAQQAEAAQLIATFKQIRHLVHGGARYQLRSAFESPFPALMFVSANRDEAVVFAFRVYAPDPAEPPPLYLRGLDTQARYLVEGTEGARSGAALMQAGLHLRLANFESRLLRLHRA